MSYFHNASFFITTDALDQLPEESIAEVAFVGRSNAGKSSTINTITRQNRLAFTSKTPGRTQHINFFSLRNHRFLVDLPGYGFAKVHGQTKRHWNQLLSDYLRLRPQLVGLIMIMDIRHPLQDSDWQMIHFFNQRCKPIHIVLTKADKISRQQQQETLKKVRLELSEYSNISLQTFSSLKKQGIEEFSSIIQPWLEHEIT
jgi:GTP-binding protein